jgi:hypothetical protein
VAAHRLPASEPATARADAGDEDKGPRLAGLPGHGADREGLSGHAIHPGRADAGRLAAEEIIMTQNKAQKTHIRQRMAETGEPYSVARHAVADGVVEDGVIEDSVVEDSVIEDYAVEGGPGEEPEPGARGRVEAERMGEEAARMRAEAARMRVEAAQAAFGSAQERAERARERAERADEAAAMAHDAADLAQEAADLTRTWGIRRTRGVRVAGISPSRPPTRCRSGLARSCSGSTSSGSGRTK